MSIRSFNSNRDCLLLAARRGAGQCLADVVAFKVRVRGQHFVRVVARRQQPHDGPNRDGKVPA